MLSIKRLNHQDNNLGTVQENYYSAAFSQRTVCFRNTVLHHNYKED